MAKKGYPGLVLVPPSDRTILRRRLLHVALFIIALVWGASTLPEWPPASDDKANCQPGVGQERSNSFAENCGQPQSVTEPLPHQNEFSLTPVSQAEAWRAKNPPPPLDPDPHDPQQSQQDSQPKSPGSRPPDDHSVVPPKSEQTVASMPASKPAHNQENDVRVADRLTTQHNHSQDSKPKSSELVNHPIDHNIIAPSGNEPTASSLSTSKPAQDLDIDARLAEQGDAFAQYRLGRYCAQHGGRQTPESVSWYKKASPGLHRLAAAGRSGRGRRPESKTLDQVASLHRSVLAAAGLRPLQVP